MINISNGKRVIILDIPFDKVTHKQALEIVLSKLNEDLDKCFFIATPNPEMLLEARKNKSFKEVLQNTDLNIPDGAGIVFASKVIGNPLFERVTGTDLMLEICKNVKKGTRIFLLGAGVGVAEKVAEKLKLLNHDLKIVGIYSGSPALDEEKEIINKINTSGADVLFVAFGSPNQEIWLARNLQYLKKNKIAMGVGGAFNFIASVRKRAPMWMRQFGIEWLYRLIQEPKRIKRIFNATVKFPLVFLFRLFRS